MSRNAIITGVSKGIGREFALYLAEQDFHVIGCARGQDGVAELKQKLGECFTGVVGDVCRDTIQNELIDKAQQRGSLDLLINNAGISFIDRYDQMALDQIQQIVNLNIVSLSQMCQKAMPLLVQSRGILLNISSVLGHFSTPYNSVYSATKHYVNGLTRALRIEYRNQGVRIFAACPGGIQTDFVRAATVGKKVSSKYLRGGREARTVARKMLRKAHSAKGVWIYPNFSARIVSLVGRCFPNLSDFLLEKIVKPRTERHVGL